MPDRSEKLRTFFARYVAARGGARDYRIEHAFASVPRESFTGPGPWSIQLPGYGYVRTPDDDLAYIYQDTLVAIDAGRGINIGEPALHARCLDALALRTGDTVLHVGAGVGYYTALLAHLVGETGRVHAYEIEADLAARATQNLAHLPWVDVQARSGIADHLPKADAVYVNAGITQPSWAWLDALRTNGRLIFPLQPVGGFGAMLMITRPRHGLVWPARFVMRAGFMSCTGPQDEETGQRLAAAFAGNDRMDRVQSFRADDAPDASSWCQGDGWWLSTATPIDWRVLDAYVGRYRLAPEYILTVTRDADRFYVQATGQDRYEMVAENEREFRCRGIEARITFETDGEGRAVRLFLHQGGKNMPAERVIEP